MDQLFGEKLMETRAPINIEEAVSEVTLTPRSPVLQDMIGQRLLDIGFYINSQLGKSSMTRDEEKQQLIDISIRCNKNNLLAPRTMFSGCGWIYVLHLEKQHLALIGSTHSFPKVSYHPNLTLDKIHEIEEKTFGSGWSKYYYFSANQDPDFADEYVTEIIGKKIIGIDLFRLKRKEGFVRNQFRYCVLKLYFEDGIERILGTHFNHDIAFHLRYSDYLDPNIVHKVFPIRKRGFMK